MFYKKCIFFETDDCTVRKGRIVTWQIIFSADVDAVFQKGLVYNCSTTGPAYFESPNNKGKTLGLPHSKNDASK